MTILNQAMKHPVAQYFLRLYQNLDEDYIGLLAAGVAFYFFLAAFPAIAALISLYGLFSDPAFVTDQIRQLEPFMPGESLKILADQATAIASTSQAALGLGVVVGILLTIYSTTKGVSALIKGLNIAYNVKERRNVLMLNTTAFTLTFVIMAYTLFALTLVALMPAFFQFIHLPDIISAALLALRWPLLFLCGGFGLQILYNYAPNLPKTQKRPLITWGAIVATMFWVGGSSLFSLFVSNFGKFNETYGSLGAVAVLLLWFWLNALCILFGAEVNASFLPKDGSKPKKPIHLAE